MALWPWTNINIWGCSGQDCDHGSVILSRLDNAEWIYKVLPVSGWISRWRYDTEEILTHRAVQAWSLIRRQKFGGNRTLYTGVMTTPSPLARDDPSPHLNVYMVWGIVTILTMVQWLDWPLLSCIVVKRPGEIHQSIKTCHFLFPPGGAVILGHNFCVKVIRPGLLSYMSSLDSIGLNMS